MTKVKHTLEMPTYIHTTYFYFFFNYVSYRLGWPFLQKAKPLFRIETSKVTRRYYTVWVGTQQGSK